MLEIYQWFEAFSGLGMQSSAGLAICEPVVPSALRNRLRDKPVVPLAVAKGHFAVVLATSKRGSKAARKKVTKSPSN